MPNTHAGLELSRFSVRHKLKQTSAVLIQVTCLTEINVTTTCMFAADQMNWAKISRQNQRVRMSVHQMDVFLLFFCSLTSFKKTIINIIIQMFPLLIYKMSLLSNWFWDVKKKFLASSGVCEQMNQVFFFFFPQMDCGFSLRQNCNPNLQCNPAELLNFRPSHQMQFLLQDFFKIFFFFNVAAYVLTQSICAAFTLGFNAKEVLFHC